MEEAGLRIRKFRKEDARKVSSVICRAQRETLTKCYSRKNIEAFCSWSRPSDIIEKSKERQYYVAVEEGKILGIIGIKENMLRTMYVNPKYHKKGIGKKLVQKIVDVARKKGLKKIKTDSTPYAEPFYKKCGFRKVKKVRVKYRGFRYYIVRMEKKL